MGQGYEIEDVLYRYEKHCPLCQNTKPFKNDADIVLITI